MADSLTRRTRVYTACLNCRKRKIKPCERCIRRNLHCKYLAVGTEESHSGRAPGDSPLPSPTYPAHAFQPPVPHHGSHGPFYGTIAPKFPAQYILVATPEQPEPMNVFGRSDGRPPSPATHRRTQRIHATAGPYHVPSSQNGRIPAPDTVGAIVHQDRAFVGGAEETAHKALQRSDGEWPK
ncbi:hypothetical protein DFH07DRAFT_777250 [Mycena maculata]|uniref:Zn(2)-C6 fungal-type domain-containing protein n=1 Tax=Mycena maculata TaxID=230809 RepID=A0AAD7IIX3_9AGAR|nr:hypothetical protein DFH07DRAFT_777250 [Mycena maculata]